MKNYWLWKISSIEICDCSQTTWIVELLHLRLGFSYRMDHWRGGMGIKIIILIHWHELSPLDGDIFNWVIISLDTIIIVYSISSTPKERIVSITHNLLIVLLEKNDTLITVTLLYVFLIFYIHELIIWLNSWMSLNLLWMFRNRIDLIVWRFLD